MGLGIVPTGRLLRDGQLSRFSLKSVRRDDDAVVVGGNLVPPGAQASGWISRHVAAVGVVLLAVTATGGFFLFARPAYHPPGGGVTIRIPAKSPAADAAGAAGWVWRDGVPGWQAGETLHGYPLSGVQPIEIQPAQLAAAHQLLDASNVRVLSAIRGNKQGALMILAAPTVGMTTPRTCLAAVLPGNAAINWQCPGATPSRSDLSHSYVLIAAWSFAWPGTQNHPVYLTGVARGDVYRVVLAGRGFAPMPLYTRGATWGQFSAVTPTPSSASHLAVYGRHRLLQKIPLDLAPGTERVLR
jgi:hypothetical protein